MKTLRLLQILVVFICFSCRSLALNLPEQLSRADIDRVVEVLGAASTTRLMRSADAYALFPGIKFGAEAVIVPSRDLNDIGDATGTLPSLNLSPRLYIAKGLLLDLEAIISFLPSVGPDLISTFGMGIKWTCLTEMEYPVNGALFLMSTSVNAFGNTLKGNNLEIGMVISRDHVRFKPYLGLGLLFAKGSIPRSLSRSEHISGSYSTVHTFIGAEIELPVNITVQFDLINLSPTGSIFLGFHF